MTNTYPFKRRAELMAAHAWDPFLQAAEMRVCQQSVVHFVNDWVWTYDPRENPTDMPFDLFGVQADFLLWIKEREDKKEYGICEKSRGQGASWLAICYAVHGWLFRRGFAAGFGSLKLEEVDEVGNMDTLLEKARFILRRLPEWMLPKDYQEAKHATHGKIVNPNNGAIITGEGGPNMGRGGRKGLFVVDEAAHLIDSDAVDSALAETAACRIDISTPHGTGNSFYKKRFSGLFPTFRLHWHDDPRKDEEWATKKKRELNNPALWAEQYEIDYTASLEGICIPAQWVRAAVELNLPESEMPKVAGLDISEAGDAKTVLISRRGPHVDLPVWWSGLNTTATAHKAADMGEKQYVSDLYYDVSGVGTGVKGAWAATGRVLQFKPHPINMGEGPTETKWPNGKTSKELFVNRRMESWWMLRARFEKAFEYKEGLAQYPADEMISIPNHPELITQLSMPLVEHRETGKLQLESKRDMRKRGIASPDFADALVLAFTQQPRRKRMVFW